MSRTTFIQVRSEHHAGLPRAGWLMVALGLSLTLPVPAWAQAGTPPPTAFTPPTTPLEEALLQGAYRGERLGDPVPSFLRADQPALLLLPALLDALRLRFSVNRDGGLAGRLQPDDLPFSFAPDGSYRIGERDGQLAPTEYRFHHGELYLTPGALALLVPVELRVDPRKQRFTLLATGPLALDLTRQRELARSRFDNRSPPRELPLQAFPYQALGRPFGDVRVNAQYGAGPGDLAFRSISYDALVSQELAFATALLYVSGSDGTRLRDARLSLGRQSPLGGVWGVPGLTGLFLGDVQAPALPLIGSSGQMRGLSLSAYPLDRPDRFDQTLVEGDAPAGWDAELLRGEELLAYQRVGPDARYRFEAVPLLFGDNALRVVLYGPDGQRREELRSFRIGSGMAPPGMLYWHAAVGQSDTRLLEQWLPAVGNKFAGATDRGRGIASIGAELGLSHRLTAAAFATRAAEDHRPGSPLRDTLGGGLRLALPTLYLESTVARQDHRGQAWSLGASGALGPLSLSARHARYDGFRSVEALQSGEPLQTETTLHLSTVAPVAGLPITLTALGEHWLFENGDREMAARMQARFSARGGLLLGQGIEWRRREHLPGSPLALRTDQLNYVPSVSGRFGPVRVSAAARYNARQGNLEELRLSGHWLISPKTSANFGLTRSRAGPEPARGYGAWAGLSRDFGRFHANVDAARSTAGDLSASIGISLSFGFDRNATLALSSRPMAGQGATDVLVFSDLDGNGRYDARTDEPLADARVRVNGQPGYAALTNQQGHVFVTGLTTLEPVTLEIDSGSISDPFMAPASGGLRFIPRSGQSFVAQLALVETGEVSGTLLVVRDETPLELSGVVVELLAPHPLDPDATKGPGMILKHWTGRWKTAPAALRATAAPGSDGVPTADIEGRYRVLSTKRTQYDGGFLFDMIPPGDYVVRIRAGQNIRGTALSALGQSVSVTREQLMVDGINLRLLAPIPDPTPSLDQASAAPAGAPASRETPWP